MSDVTVKRLEDLEGYGGESHGGNFLYAGKGLGVTAWAMNVLRLPAGWDHYPDHDHADDGQEEVYVVIEGSARLEADGESWQLEPGTLARVGAAQRRRIMPGDEGVTIVAIGATPGKAFQPRS
jgi:mannose-6-phosphate isomerase-like protein (cupin superfamily)